MRIQEKQKALEQEVIANLCAIPKMRENMLPHTVYVLSLIHISIGYDDLHIMRRARPKFINS